MTCVKEFNGEGKISEIIFRKGSKEGEVNKEQRREQNVEQEINRTGKPSTFLQVHPGTSVFAPLQFFRFCLSVLVLLGI